ncbi:uncharacterized protein PHACADRAFT_260044 [Phanerochaete carnosa HHB-10118-sp]|uniref:Uncharacterized protein n=1 Tax=Phanerochaete carnosa (strain HHB-10118-sp) TaxID=650164 RepID=K5W3U1_PHACS|nr:uncharacterized protein PHACADRAFT_260044 [Phanerochaete carnosa HHB-10118-sp]EKM53604.1 hypothetical protein PHACADRAFT_260044 [Phanerochaete carnosa HHB-10118-sp]
MSTVMEESSSSNPVLSNTDVGAHRIDSTKQPVLYIRPWDGITSTPQAYAILRAIERRYGRLKHYTFRRDHEASDMYQPYFFAEFESGESLEMLPLGRQTIQLEIPIYDRTPSGGIGLQDLRGLLRPENRLEGELVPEASVITRMAAETASKSDAVEEKPTTRVVDVWIERSDRKKPAVFTTFSLTKYKRNMVCKAFAEWGGFYEPPLPPQPQSEEDRLFSPPPPPPKPEVKRKYMDAVLSEWLPKIEAERRELEALRKEVTSQAELEAFIAAQEPAETDVPEDASTHVVEAAPEPEPEPELEPELEPEPAKPVQPRIGKKRERLLTLARQNARTPLPETLKPLSLEQRERKKLEKEQKSADEEQIKSTVRERLWKLMGGKWL